jgi:hypothetical protein
MAVSSNKGKRSFRGFRTAHQFQILSALELRHDYRVSLQKTKKLYLERHVPVQAAPEGASFDGINRTYNMTRLRRLMLRDTIALLLPSKRTRIQFRAVAP